MRQQRHTFQEHRGAPPWNGQQHNNDCWGVKPMLGRVAGHLHFPVPSLNRLEKTEPVTFSVLSFLAFFGDFVFLFLQGNYNRVLIREKELLTKNEFRISDNSL
jgi:hypothetical protein